MSGADRRPRWKTRLVTQPGWKCRMPIIGAPMAGVSGGRLAAAICRGGAMGFIAAGHLSSLDSLQQEIEVYHQEMKKNQATPSSSSSTAPDAPPLYLGFISHSTLATEDGWKRLEKVLATHRPAVVQFTAPPVVTRARPDPVASPISTPSDDSISRPQATNVSLSQQYQAKVLVQVGSVSEAKQALQAQADGIIVQGSEAGGHGLRRELGNGTLPLASAVVALVAASDRPETLVLAAGGMADGRGLAAALALGCDGLVLGTRLWATWEALGPDTFKQRLVETESCDDVIRSTVFDQIGNTYSSNPWPYPYDSVGAVRNQTSETWDGRPFHELAKALQPVGPDEASSPLQSHYRQAMSQGDPAVGVVHCGQGVHAITSIESAETLLAKIEQEAVETLQSLQFNTLELLPSAAKND